MDAEESSDDRSRNRANRSDHRGDIGGGSEPCHGDAENNPRRTNAASISNTPYLSRTSSALRLGFDFAPRLTFPPGPG